MRYKYRSERLGFSLVEVIVGLSIFMIVIAAVSGVLFQSFQIYESARDTNRISQILQYQVENVRATQWADLTNLSASGKTSINVDTSGVPGSDTVEVPFDWKAFTLEQTITATETSLYDGEWTATWTDRRGRVRSKTYKTKFFEDGLNTFYVETRIEN